MNKTIGTLDDLRELCTDLLMRGYSKQEILEAFTSIMDEKAASPCCVVCGQRESEHGKRLDGCPKFLKPLFIRPEGDK